MNIHPGLSKIQMKNAILIANEYLNMIPEAETPAHTEMYEGMCKKNGKISAFIFIL